MKHIDPLTKQPCHGYETEDRWCVLCGHRAPAPEPPVGTMSRPVVLTVKISAKPPLGAMRMASRTYAVPLTEAQALALQQKIAQLMIDAELQGASREC